MKFERVTDNIMDCRRVFTKSYLFHYCHNSKGSLKVHRRVMYLYKERVKGDK